MPPDKQTLIDIVLYEPEIPPNTGNAVRLAANSGAHLHLVRPLGFNLRNKALVRSGLDYHDLAQVTLHADWRACRAHFSGRRLYAVTTRGAQRHDAPHYQEGDVFVFGPETRGLPAEVLHEFPEPLRISHRLCWRPRKSPGGVKRSVLTRQVRLSPKHPQIG